MRKQAAWPCAESTPLVNSISKVVMAMLLLPMHGTRDDRVNMVYPWAVG